MAIAKPKGTFDILPPVTDDWIYIENKIREVCKLFNFNEIRTPIFESSDLFHRNNTDTSDMITKETYNFQDRSERNLTLRPEGTAGVVRSFIENKLYIDNPITKLFYVGPMFRYERPQAGRQRQFNQFGMEIFGNDSPFLDAQIILAAIHFLKSIKLSNARVRINCIGDIESRNKYKEVLIKYFSKYESDLCEDCKNRLLKNPLRVLDCKIDSKKEYFNGAPLISDYLNDYSKEHFNKLINILKDNNVEFVLDNRLVRGLDYYSLTVFEIDLDIKELGNQNVICGGGRYDNLVSQLGGPETKAVGLAFGLERVIQILKLLNIPMADKKSIDVFFIALDDDASKICFNFMKKLSDKGVCCEMDYFQKSLKQQFKLSDKYNPKYTCVVGCDELQNDIYTFKSNIEELNSFKLTSSEMVCFDFEKGILKK
ncbi:MAG: histidine--tRNA ligase [Anaeroplasmataceae bacterium]